MKFKFQVPHLLVLLFWVSIMQREQTSNTLSREPEMRPISEIEQEERRMSVPRKPKRRRRCMRNKTSSFLDLDEDPFGLDFMEHDTEMVSSSSLPPQRKQKIANTILSSLLLRETGSFLTASGHRLQGRISRTQRWQRDMLLAPPATGTPNTAACDENMDPSQSLAVPRTTPAPWRAYAYREIPFTALETPVSTVLLGLVKDGSYALGLSTQPVIESRVLQSSHHLCGEVPPLVSLHFYGMPSRAMRQKRQFGPSSKRHTLVAPLLRSIPLVQDDDDEDPAGDGHCSALQLQTLLDCNGIGLVLFLQNDTSPNVRIFCPPPTPHRNILSFSLSSSIRWTDQRLLWRSSYLIHRGKLHHGFGAVLALGQSQSIDFFYISRYPVGKVVERVTTHCFKKTTCIIRDVALPGNWKDAETDELTGVVLHEHEETFLEKPPPLDDAKTKMDRLWIGERLLVNCSILVQDIIKDHPKAGLNNLNGKFSYELISVLDGRYVEMAVALGTKPASTGSSSLCWAINIELDLYGESYRTLSWFRAERTDGLVGKCCTQLSMHRRAQQLQLGPYRHTADNTELFSIPIHRRTKASRPRSNDGSENDDFFPSTGWPNFGCELQSMYADDLSSPVEEFTCDMPIKVVYG